MGLTLNLETSPNSTEIQDGYEPTAPSTVSSQTLASNAILQPALGGERGGNVKMSRVHPVMPENKDVLENNKETPHGWGYVKGAQELAERAPRG